jgi:hypothetical protein
MAVPMAVRMVVIVMRMVVAHGLDIRRKRQRRKGQSTCCGGASGKASTPPPHSTFPNSVGAVMLWTKASQTRRNLTLLRPQSGRLVGA